jgi:uncharacterized membrane protein
LVLLLAGTAYFILTRTLISHHGKDSQLAKAVGRDVKGKVSVLLYAVAIPSSFWAPLIACAVYVLVAVMWLIPDRRIERVLAE